MATTFIRRTSKGIGQTVVSIGSYTVPTAKSATVVGLNVCNMTAAAITANVAVANSSGIVTYLVVNAIIPPGSAFVPSGGPQKIVLQAGDSVRVVANTASSVDAYLSLVEGL